MRFFGEQWTYESTILLAWYLAFLFCCTHLHCCIIPLNSLNGMKHVLLSIVQFKSLDITYPK